MCHSEKRSDEESHTSGSELVLERSEGINSFPRSRVGMFLLIQSCSEYNEGINIVTDSNIGKPGRLQDSKNFVDNTTRNVVSL